MYLPISGFGKENNLSFKICENTSPEDIRATPPRHDTTAFGFFSPRSRSPFFWNHTKPLKISLPFKSIFTMKSASLRWIRSRPPSPPQSCGVAWKLPLRYLSGMSLTSGPMGRLMFPQNPVFPLDNSCPSRPATLSRAPARQSRVCPLSPSTTCLCRGCPCTSVCSSDRPHLLTILTTFHLLSNLCLCPEWNHFSLWRKSGS